MSKNKTVVVRTLSALSSIVENTKTAVAPSEEDASGGFVVGTVLDDTQLSEEKDSTLKEPTSGDMVYFSLEDEMHMIEFHGEVPNEPSQIYYLDTATDKYLKTEDLEWDEENAVWLRVVPSWAGSMVGNYRASANVSENVEDRWIFDAIEEARGNDEEDTIAYIKSYFPLWENHVQIREIESQLSDGLITEFEYATKLAALDPTEENLALFEFAKEKASFNDDPHEVSIDDDSDEDDTDLTDTAVIELIPVESELTDEALVSDSTYEETDEVEEVLNGDSVIEEDDQGTKPISNVEILIQEILSDEIGENVSDNEVTILAGDVVATLEGVDEERAGLIKQIAAYLPPGEITKTTPFARMDTFDLGKHLQFLRQNNGGSPAALEILREVESEFERLINDPDTKRRLALLERKGADFHAMAQQMSRIMGNEVVIKGMRYQEYHTLLQTLTRSATVIHKEIAAAADYLGIEIPIHDLAPSLGSVPILEGMAIDEKTAMFILRTMLRHVEHWHHTALLLQEKFDNTDSKVEELEETLRVTREKLKHETTSREEMLKNVQARFIEMPEYYIYIAAGGFLCLIDDDEKLSSKNLTFTSDIREAMFLTSKKAAERIIEVLQEKEKFADYKFLIRRLAAIEV